MSPSVASGRISAGSDLGSDGLRCLAQHGEMSQVLNAASPLGKLLEQREVEGEDERLHQMSDRILRNTNVQNRLCLLNQVISSKCLSVMSVGGADRMFCTCSHRQSDPQNFTPFVGHRQETGVCFLPVGMETEAGLETADISVHSELDS